MRPFAIARQLLVCGLLAASLGGCHYYRESIPEPRDDNPLIGIWRLVAIQAPGAAEKPVEPQPVYTLEFATNTRLAGQADCNRYFGGYERAKNRQIRVLAIGATQAACPPESLSNEFLRLLGAAERFEISDGNLRLTAVDGTLLILAR